MLQFLYLIAYTLISSAQKNNYLFLNKTLVLSELKTLFKLLPHYLEQKDRCRLRSSLVEVVVSRMYPTLLCAITVHVPFKTRLKDTYFIEGTDREEVKAALTPAVGGGTPN